MIKSLRVWTKFCLFLILTHAGFVEAAQVTVVPYLGYSQHGFSENLATEHSMATILGVMAGVAFKNLFVGLDYHTGGIYEHTDDVDKRFRNEMFGGGAAWTFSKGRLWLGFYDHCQLEDSNQFLSYKGTAYKISLGIQLRKNLFLNFEHIAQNINERSQYGILTTTLPDPLSSSVSGISVSSVIDVF